MIIYARSKAEFRADVLGNRIETVLHQEYQRSTGRQASPGEFEAWKHSLRYMHDVLDLSGVVDDASVAVEYMIPQTSRRVDVIVCGQNHRRSDVAVIVELKQWEEAGVTELDAVVETWLGGARRQVLHPSYQSWSYASLLQDFNQAVEDDGIELVPCAYLHNCTTPDTLRDPRYHEHLRRAPVFLRQDAQLLADFIKQHIHHGDGRDVLYRIEHGRIRPSRNLADQLVSLLQGNREFTMIDEQKLVYERSIALANKASSTRQKQVFIVQGGPGTGKSVVAINLLVELTKRELNVRYVTRNAAPRHVYEAKLVGSMSKSRISNMFSGSGSFVGTPEDTFDVLLVDEAHRLNAKSGMFQNLGENQVKELIAAARCTIFLIDEDQQVTWKDIGTTAEIRGWAAEAGAQVHEGELLSQFRCNGSDGYLAWTMHALQLRETANRILNQDGQEYDLRVCDGPQQLLELIRQHNGSNKARMVAGYCWPWVSKTQPKRYDIEFPEHGFRMQWNLASDGNHWILKPKAVEQIGCIHTCQGLELDYIGVIIGPDLVVRDGIVVTDATQRAKTDSSVKGFKSQLKKDPEASRARADRIIKNTYRTLMTRGQKGCFIWCTDPETNAYFKALLREVPASATVQAEPTAAPIPFQRVSEPELEPFINALPLYDLKASAGAFSEAQAAEQAIWVRPPAGFAPAKDLFLLQVIGESMNKSIPNGAWCLWRRCGAGSRNGKTVLAEYHGHLDVDHGGHYTVKRYHSSKVAGTTDQDWSHATVVLKPNSTDPRYRDIVIPPDEAEEFAIVAELVAVLEVQS